MEPRHRHADAPGLPQDCVGAPHDEARQSKELLSLAPGDGAKQTNPKALGFGANLTEPCGIRNGQGVGLGE